jgi:hypothetical protein
MLSCELIRLILTAAFPTLPANAEDKVDFGDQEKPPKAGQILDFNL